MLITLLASGFLLFEPDFYRRGDYDVNLALHLLMEANHPCFSGETLDGEKLDDASIQAACAETISRLHDLHDHGWCFDKGIERWRFCED